MHVPKNRVSNYIKQKLTELITELNKNTEDNHLHLIFTENQ